MNKNLQMKAKNVMVIALLAISSIVTVNAQKSSEFGGLNENKIGPKTIKLPGVAIAKTIEDLKKGL